MVKFHQFFHFSICEPLRYLSYIVLSKPASSLLEYSFPCFSPIETPLVGYGSTQMPLLEDLLIKCLLWTRWYSESWGHISE